MGDPIEALPFALNDSVTEQANSVYSDLDEGHIRLLKVLPGDPPDEIYCKIDQFELNSKPKYTALSYTWGSGPAICVIRLNGHRFLVKKNLWRFLHQIRDTGNDASR
jgi:hypothetical protein